MKNDEESDISDDMDDEDIEERPEPQFIVKLGKKSMQRKRIHASMDEAPPGDENYQHPNATSEKVLAKKKRKIEDNARKLNFIYIFIFLFFPLLCYNPFHYI